MIYAGELEGITKNDLRKKGKNITIEKLKEQK